MQGFLLYNNVMRVVFEHWKYIFRNLWFVLPFAVVPAIFLAFSVDFAGIEDLARAFFTGTLEPDFLQILRAWSFVRFDSVLGIIYSVFAVVSLVIFTVFLLAFVEKHMRIGKRTLSGVFSQIGGHLWAAIGVTALYTVLYELWAIVLSAVLFAVCSIGEKTFASILFALVSVIFMAALLFLVSVFYLLLPCMQITGFRAYGAFIYSYRLTVGVRKQLLLSFAVSYVPAFLVIMACAFLPTPVAVIVAFILFMFLYLSFCVRMETLYFATDKLDREDLLRSYKEL